MGSRDSAPGVAEAAIVARAIAIGGKSAPYSEDKGGENLRALERTLGRRLQVACMLPVILPDSALGNGPGPSLALLATSVSLSSP